MKGSLPKHADSTALAQQRDMCDGWVPLPGLLPSFTLPNLSGAAPCAKRAPRGRANQAHAAEGPR